jgi:hypothetical protein
MQVSSFKPSIVSEVMYDLLTISTALSVYKKFWEELSYATIMSVYKMGKK